MAKFHIKYSKLNANKDLTGRTFGELYVDGYAGSHKNRRMWWCICSCGELRKISGNSLKNGNTKSCGIRENHIVNLVGNVYNKLTVIEFDGYRNSNYYWTCRCECNNITVVRVDHLLKDTQSCGCIRGPSPTAIESNTIHGMVGTSIYGRWSAMLDRCRNPNHKSYHNYGGRGITVCERWHDFSNFYEDIKDGYAPTLTIERKDVNGNYDPDNVIWVDMKAQGRNRRNTIYVNYNGNDIPLSELAEIIDVSYETLWERYNRGDRGDRLARPVTGI
jgi:hypothetical protein